MSGIRELAELLKSMKPVLQETDMVFCSVDYDNLPEQTIDPLMFFKEEKGITLVLPKTIANRLSLDYVGLWVRITMTVHSSLDAVGFLAKISEALANAGISANVVSAFYHDHIFVPKEKAKDAMKVLKQLSKSSE
ncbi:MAG: ACT domain-containing protein [Candidatus Thorarchaeota archaeon]